MNEALQELRARREANWLKSSRQRAIEARTPWEPVTRADVYRKGGGRCAYCRRPLLFDGEWEPDHVRPVRVGGATSLVNLVPACRPCNRAKGGKWAMRPNAAEVRATMLAWWYDGVRAQLAGYREAPQCRTMQFAIRPKDVGKACSPKSVEMVSAALQLPSGVSVMIQRDGGLVEVQVPRRQPLIVPLRTMWARGWEVALGVDARGRVYSADLERAPHWLVAGVTGGGKSTVLSNALALLALQHSPSTLRIAAIDTKGELLHGPLATLPHVQWHATNEGEAELCIAAMLDELQVRIAERRSTPRYVIAIDEAHDVPTARLLRLAKMGRTFGMNLLMASQRAVGKDVPTDLSTQCSVRICTRLTPGDRWTAGQMVPDHNPMLLRSAGDMLAWQDGVVVRFAGAYAPAIDPFWTRDDWPVTDGVERSGQPARDERHWSRRPKDMPDGLTEWIAEQSERIGDELRMVGVKRIIQASQAVGRKVGWKTAQRWQAAVQKWMLDGVDGSDGADGAAEVDDG